jgi:hypothetical protein
MAASARTTATLFFFEVLGVWQKGGVVVRQK